jgi:hypothetical protein
MSASLRLFDAGMKPIAVGESRPGESLRDTLVRLYQATLTPDAPRRKVMFFATAEDRPSGSPTMVVTGYEQCPGIDVADPPIFFKTDKPRHP